VQLGDRDSSGCKLGIPNIYTQNQRREREYDTCQHLIGPLQCHVSAPHWSTSARWAPPWYKSLTGGPHLSATWQSASGPPHPLCATWHNHRKPPPLSVPHGTTTGSHLTLSVPHGIILQSHLIQRVPHGIILQGHLTLSMPHGIILQSHLSGC
jgi:hypothetical protein